MMVAKSVVGLVAKSVAVLGSMTVAEKAGVLVEWMEIGKAVDSVEM